MLHEMSVDPFVTHRRLLFTVAYEMLGSAADADDVVQETWLRWADIDQAEVRDARAYLVRILTRQALNRLRTLARRREVYVGQWLPEPLLTSPDVADAAPGLSVKWCRGSVETVTGIASGVPAASCWIRLCQDATDRGSSTTPSRLK